MDGTSALFVRICMSGDACKRWLDSRITRVSDYGDWPEMNPEAAGMGISDDDTRQRRGQMTVREFLDDIADGSSGFCCEYDDGVGAFFIADARHESGAARIASTIAALRGAERFKDDDEPSFIYVFPALSGGDPDAILRVGRGSSRFLRPEDSSPDVLYFVNEAEEFIEELMSDEDD
jgi:hypothetical protein